MKESKSSKQEYNKSYYLKNREFIIKQNSEYQKKPEVKKKRKIRIRKRYKENHLNFRTKNLRSHDKLKLKKDWWIKQRARISICGICSYNPIKNKIKWDNYYKKNKEKYKSKRRNDNSLKINSALRRLENNREISKEEQLKDINLLKQEIIKLKASLI